MAGGSEWGRPAEDRLGKVILPLSEGEQGPPECRIVDMLTEG